MLIVTEYIRKTELDKVSKYFSLNDIKNAVNKLASSGIEVSNLGYRDCKIVKVRIGKQVKGRMIVFIQLTSDYYIPVMLRLKKDKMLGENLSLNNSLAKEKIIYNIDRILEDLKNGKYIKFNL